MSATLDDAQAQDAARRLAEAERGSFTRPVHATGGDVFLADYGPLGTVSIRFGAAP